MRTLLAKPRQTYKLLNHGPTTLITSAHDGKVNIMAAAWVMAIDFEPPKLCAIISSDTYTSELVRASREMTINLPTVAQAALTYKVGSVSGREGDKFARYEIATAPASKVKAPLIEGCAAWLECRVLEEPHVESAYDMYIAEVVAAWYDDTLFKNGEWAFDARESRTIHHLAKGTFFATGERVTAE